jgi:hypothetical protein
MSFPMIFCTWKEANDFGFHDAIMDDTAWMAFGIALVVGGLCSLIYYLVVGKSARMSNLLTWFIALVLGLAINFFVTDSIIVGSPISKQNGVNQNSLVYEYSFFHSIDNHAKELVNSKKYKDNPEAKQKINDRKRDLSKAVEKGKDVVLTYELSCLFWTLFAFIFVSYCIKNSTEQASSVPTYWPQKRN